MISLCINTCALGEKSRSVLSSGKQPHEQRAFSLRNFVLPAAIADPTFDEIIVVGEWEPGDGYTYIEVPSEHFSCVDALQQRQVGFERSRGGIIFFQHDDHMLERMPFWDETENAIILWIREPHDVVVPSRYTRLRNVNGEKLYNGWPWDVEAKDLFGDDVRSEYSGYISGHLAIYRRDVLEACPWGDVPKQHTWDVAHTAQIRAAGFTIEWSEALRCYDIEAGSTPWR